MRLKLAILSFLATGLAQFSLFGQPSQSDKYKYAPLVSAARLWNMIRYLHPQVTGDSTQWDAALIAAIPKIEAAHSDEDLAVALDAMLETLHDPCTRIAFGLPGKGLSVQSSDSETMVIHAGNGDLSGSLGAGLMLKMGIPQTNNVVWDLRGSRMPLQLSVRPDIQQLRLNGIGYAYREHVGYPPEDGTGLRYYSSSLKIVDSPRTAATRPVPTRKQVYLIDKNSAVPIQAIIDQVNGRTAILSEDPPGTSQAGFTELVSVLGKVVAEVRVAELRYPDGTTEFAPTRVVLNRGEEAVKAAVNAINTGLLPSASGMPGERPEFEPGSSAFRDMPYADNSYPSREMRILAAIRIWGILHYFHPYVAVMGDKWDDVLVDFLPRFSEAKNAREYHLAVAEMAARTGDVSCTARSSETAELFGPATAPLEVRFIEKQPVITRVFKPGVARPGDIILKIDDQPVQNRIDELSRYMAAPSPAALLSQVGRFLLTARSSGTLKVTLQGKDGAPQTIAIAVSDTKQKLIPASRGGDAVRLINERIGYADVEGLESSELDASFEKLHQAAAIIFDLRGYPKDNALGIASRLGNRNQPVVAEFIRNVIGLGTSDSHISFLQTELRVPRSAKQRYLGKTVALIDDASASLTGESAMCLKAANNTVLVGSTTFPIFVAYSTRFDVPGGIRIFFSGQAPRWPGGKLLYPEGVHPDVEVRSTIAGIRAGRDEVLEAAVEYLGKNLN
jgi:C-terminal processing protease CtpA/Prc